MSVFREVRPLPNPFDVRNGSNSNSDSGKLSLLKRYKKTLPPSGHTFNIPPPPKNAPPPRPSNGAEVYGQPPTLSQSIGRSVPAGWIVTWKGDEKEEMRGTNHLDLRVGPSRLSSPRVRPRGRSKGSTSFTQGASRRELERISVEDLHVDLGQQEQTEDNSQVVNLQNSIGKFEVEQKLPGVVQDAVDLEGLVLSSEKPHNRLLELLQTNRLSKESVVDWLQVRSQSTLDSTLRRKYTKCLYTVVKKYHIFPSSFFIRDVLLDGLPHCPQKRGGFADIYKGTIGKRMVCLKLLRIYLDYDENKRGKLRTNFCKEALIWTQLYHPNIVPLIGVNADLFEPEFCLVSPWMANGDIISFLKRNPKHDRLQSICDIAAGLGYLHSLRPVVVHGDIKGANVLVDENCNCLLSDFGLSKTITQTTGLSTNTGSSLGGSIRWMAPELFHFSVENGEKQYKSPRDVYAFGCTVLEIMTEKPPFPDLNDGAVLHQVANNKARPARPITGWCPDDVWNLVTLCWKEDPSQRPRAASISAYLGGLQNGTGTREKFFFKQLVEF